MKFLDINGDVTLCNEDGVPVTVITIKHGMMFRMLSKTQMTTIVSVNPGVNNLSDTWLFFQEKTIPMQCIQSRDVVPALRDVYKEFFAKTEDYSLEDFVSRVVADYFIGKLHYTIRPSLITDELIK
jgi:hypothetical protein